MLNLDTHILLHSLTGDLTKQEQKILSKNTWSISSVVLWEISKLIQLEKISIDPSDPDLNRILSRIHTWPMTWEICKAIHTLDFSSDPADEIIGATSIIHQVPLLTRDKKILRSKIVPLA